MDLTNWENQSDYPVELVVPMAEIAADAACARLNEYPVVFSQCREPYRHWARVERRKSRVLEVRFCLPLPEISRGAAGAISQQLFSRACDGDKPVRSRYIVDAPERLLKQMIHEFHHVFELQCMADGEDVLFDEGQFTASGRRTEHDTRPEEVRADRAMERLYPMVEPPARDYMNALREWLIRESVPSGFEDLRDRLLAINGETV